MKKKRLNLSLTAKSYDRLIALKVNSESDTISETVRHALAIYELLVNAKNSGDRVLLQGPQGDREVILS